MDAQVKIRWAGNMDAQVKKKFIKTELIRILARLLPINCELSLL